MTYRNAHFIIVSQTNPHVLPFFFNTGHTGRVSQHHHGSGLRGGFILNALEKLFKTDMKKWISLLNEYSLLPDFFGTDWRLLWSQPLTGTITVVPKFNIFHFMRIITDPDRYTMIDYKKRGSRAVYPAMVRISNHLRLENTIQQSYELLVKLHSEQKTVPLNNSDSDIYHTSDQDSDMSDYTNNNNKYHNTQQRTVPNTTHTRSSKTIRTTGNKNDNNSNSSVPLY